MEKEATPIFMAEKIFFICLKSVPSYVDIVTAEVIAKENALNTVKWLIEEVQPEFWGSEKDKAYARYVYYTQIKEELEKL